MKLPDRPVVPLLMYSAPYGPDKGNNPNYDLSAIWGLYRATDGNGCEQVIEARVLLGGWHNFCGGGRYFSPQILRHPYEPSNSWGTPQYSWPGGHGGRTASGLIPSFKDAWPKTRKYVPNLNDILKRDRIPVAEIENIMRDSLAGALLGHMHDTNKRFWVGADRNDGQLSRLTARMKTLGSTHVFRSPVHAGISPHSSNLQDRTWKRNLIPPCGVAKYEIDVFEAKGMNWNSGANCTMYTVVLKEKPGKETMYFGKGPYDVRTFFETSGMSDTCPNCGESYSMEVTDEDTIQCMNCDHVVVPPTPPQRKKQEQAVEYYANALNCAVQKFGNKIMHDHIPYSTWGN